MIKEVQFDEEAIEYIRKRLSYGKTFSAFLLSLPLTSGQVLAYLPEDVDPAASRRFEEGGVIPAELERARELPGGGRLIPVRTRPLGHATYQKLLKFITSYLTESQGRYAIFEDANMRPSDPVFGRRRTRVITHGNEVFHLVGSPAASVESTDLLVKEARSWLLIGALASPPDGTDFRDGQEVTSEILKLLAEHTDHLIIGAYDGEGELIWSRQ